jgi:cysteinyl-tRNA synthetase
MRIYNTMTGQKEEFQSLLPGQLRLYVCGPTVYDLLHIGNARPMVVFDTLRRYFLSKGYEVTYVQNYTDVDDKIIQRAADFGISTDAVADKYILEASQDAQGLNCLPPTHAPRATEVMKEIIHMIQTLQEKGFAYETNGTVFFSTSRFPGYGKLSGKNLEELNAGARVEINDNKQNAMDFVLWKPDKPGEPKWNSPWGTGRPGWHIECSAMAKKYLGATFDIHAGGEDLIFPHHENEIAQSEAANGTMFARHWMHVRYINVNEKKMSKSLGNFFTLREVAEEFSYMTIRFFLLSAHYRSPLNFSRELLQAAENGLQRIRNCVNTMHFAAANHAAESWQPGEKEIIDAISPFAADFYASLEDDLNTADAIAAIFDLVKYANVHTTDKLSRIGAATLRDEIQKRCEILGINLSESEPGASRQDREEIKKIEALIEQRRQARQNKNWAEADRIRSELQSRGVVIEDRQDGSVRWEVR